MNYLTNYYKNLSEQLQEKVFKLENYLRILNEDLESDTGTMMQTAGGGFGAGTSPTSSNQSTNNTAQLNALLQSWGTSNPQFDYNGDGVVDGDDLGTFLANWSNNSSSTPVAMASFAAPTTQETETIGGQAGRSSRKAMAVDQPSVRGISNRILNGGRGEAGIEKKNQTPRLGPPNIPYSTATKQSRNRLNPTADTGLGFQNLNTQNTRNRGEQPPQTAMGTQVPPPPGYGPDGYHLYDFNKDGFVDGNDLGRLFQSWGNPETNASFNAEYDVNQDGFIDGNDLGSLFQSWGTQPFIDPNSGGGGEPPPQTNSGSPRENVPYWMSGKTTEIDTGFRSMQRRRRK